MAKNAKKISALGLHPEDFQETRLPPVQESTHTYNPTQDDVHTHTHESTHSRESEQESTHTSTQEYADVSTHTPVSKSTHKSTSTHKQTDVYEPESKETKTKRIQLLTYESLIQRVDAYAAKRGVTRTVVIEAAIEYYLGKVDPKK